MSHALTLNNVTGRYEMAFVGETPWHGLGQEVSQGATIEQMRAAACLEWSANEAIVQYVATREHGPQVRQHDDKKVIYRSDNGAPIGLVGSNYKPHQPAEILEFFRDAISSDGWYIATAGTLDGGSRLWVMASRGDSDEVIQGDRITENLLLATSFDGSMKTTALMTAIRVVCQNTLGFAMQGRKGKMQKTDKNTTATEQKANGSRESVAVSHRGAFDETAVFNLKQQLTGAADAYQLFKQKAQEMAQTEISKEEATEILRGLFGQPLRVKDTAESSRQPMPQQAGQDAAGSDFAALLMQPRTGVIETPEARIKREQKSVARCLALFGGEGLGADHIGSINTRWGLLNAITQHIDHEQGRTDNARLSSAFFGKGQEIKNEAFELLMAQPSSTTI